MFNSYPISMYRKLVMAVIFPRRKLQKSASQLVTYNRNEI